MHRGSSKAAGSPDPAAETLPLSASTSPSLRIEVIVESGRARSSAPVTVHVAVGTRLRDVIQHAGQAPEGSVVLIDGVSVPLDTPLERAARLVVLPTFSGG
jgi:sulfur carrier protein ThiS